MQATRRLLFSMLAVGIAWVAAVPCRGQNPPAPDPNPPPVVVVGGVTNGVLVDADGVLRRQAFPDPTGNLTRQRIAAARAELNPEVAKYSPLRMVSLTRLEAALRARLEAGKPIEEEMKYLAGLTRAQYLFYYPETNDIVIAGPAEGWVVDLSGRVLGMESGRPVLELQDLAVALRAFPPAAKQVPVLLCSIDPTAEGLSAMQQFLKQVGSVINPSDTRMIVNGLRTSLGMQNIRVGGVPANTHFAQVMIEADYRMKLIGIGVERPGIRLASYVDRANPRSSNRNSLQRWYFIPDYQCVKVADDQQGLELVGEGVKLVNEHEVVHADGSRSGNGNVDKASQEFVEEFTEKYGQLSARNPVFGQLRNLIDLAVMAVYMQKENWYGKAGWQVGALGNEQQFAVQTLNTPVQVETVVAAVVKGNRLMTPIGGGVQIHPRQALESENLLVDETGEVGKTRAQLAALTAAGDRWWWDTPADPEPAPAKSKKKGAVKPDRQARK